jgi:hypothetical protein
MPARSVSPYWSLRRLVNTRIAAHGLMPHACERDNLLFGALEACPVSTAGSKTPDCWWLELFWSASNVLVPVIHEQLSKDAADDTCTSSSVNRSGPGTYPVRKMELGSRGFPSSFDATREKV